MDEKIDKYYNLLYSNQAQLSSEEQYYAAGDKRFIRDNIDMIDRKFQDVVAESEMLGEEINEQEIIKLVFDEVRTDKYTDLLHPDRAQLSSEERYYAAGDKRFIFDNIDIIDRIFRDMVVESEMRGEEINEQEIMQLVFDGVRADKYTDLLHPDRAQLSPEERYYAAGDKRFISDNIDMIDRKFKDMIVESEIRGEEINKHEILREIISELRTKQITPQEIGKATVNAPTMAKKEAEQVENHENTRDNIKEGEEK